MNEIRCPHCGKTFQVDESGYEAILRQVRDEEFTKELDRSVRMMENDKKLAVELAVAQAHEQAKDAAAAQSARIAELEAKVKAAQEQRAADERASQAELQQRLTAAVSERDSQIAELQAQLASAAREQEAREAARKASEQALKAEQQRALEAAVAESRARVAQLEQQLAGQADAARVQQELAVQQARGQVERERDELAAQVRLKEMEKSQAESALREQMAIELKAKDDIIAFKDSEIERVRDMKSKLSTKMVGESLEQHCEIEFNKLRPTAFPNAYFEKDNDVIDGTKGDFVFRERDAEGNEIISIMFEMKNESDESVNRHKNEDFFKKLDSDRTKKGCEYAVLVTLLEPENDLYNQGIVDVSYRYDKMYVIRPQFFIPLITLLRNAALKSSDYRRQLADMRRQNVDVTHFEDQLNDFKDGFGKNYERAHRKFDAAIKDIDATIKKLEKIREELTSSDNNLRLANKKLEGLTVKKLTRKNPTMKAAFEEAAERKAAGLSEPYEDSDWEVVEDDIDDVLEVEAFDGADFDEADDE